MHTNTENMHLKENSWYLIIHQGIKPRLKWESLSNFDSFLIGVVHTDFDVQPRVIHHVFGWGHPLFFRKKFSRWCKSYLIIIKASDEGLFVKEKIKSHEWGWHNWIREWCIDDLHIPKLRCKYTRRIQTIDTPNPL